MKTNEKLNVVNLTINNEDNKADNDFLLSDINFSLNEGQTLSMYFNKKEEQESFLDIFNGNRKFYGFFNLNNCICNYQNKFLNKNATLFKSNIFEHSDESKSIFQIIEPVIQKNQSKKISKKIYSNNKLDKHLKIYKILNFKKIDYSYLKSVNIILNKAINNIDELITKFKNSNFQPIYDEFAKMHFDYLQTRVKMLIDKHIAAIDLYFENYKEYFFFRNNEELNNKINEAFKLFENLKKIYGPSSINFLIKIKNEIERSYFVTQDYKEKRFTITKHIDNRKIFNKSIVDSFILNLQNKRQIYEKRLKVIVKGTQNYQKFAKRKDVCDEFIRILKAEKNNFEYLSQKESLDFFNDLNMQYKLFLNDKDFSNGITSENILQANKNNWLRLIKSEIQSILKKYIDVSSETKVNIETLESEIKDENKYDEFASFKKNNKIKKLEINLKDILDEINWEKKRIFLNLKEKLNIIMPKIFEEAKKYRLLKKIYNKKVSIFLDKKKQIAEKNKKYDLKEEKSYTKKIFNYEKIYNFLSPDIAIIDKMFVKNVLVKKNVYSFEINSISKYLFLKEANLMKINIFELFKKQKRVSEVLKKKILLILSAIDDKKLIVLDEFMSNIESDDYDELKKSYLNITRTTNKFWILTCSNLKKYKDVSTEISIIDNSKQIEYGIANVICKKPLYDVTFKALNKKPISNRNTPKFFGSIIDFDNNNDYYVLDNERIVFGNIEQIYEWSKLIPKESILTISKEQIENFQNKLTFEKIRLDNMKKKKTSKSIQTFRSKEILIVDVK